MNKRQKFVCAIALFADGWSHDQIATALQVTREDAVKLVDAGAAAIRKGTLGQIKNTEHDGQVVAIRADDGTVLETAPKP